jgi:hypothetical protein
MTSDLVAKSLPVTLSWPAAIREDKLRTAKRIFNFILEK